MIELTVGDVVASAKSVAAWLEGVGHQSLMAPDNSVIVPDAAVAAQLLRLYLPAESRA